jgi:hypothetical protein
VLYCGAGTSSQSARLLAAWSSTLTSQPARCSRYVVFLFASWLVSNLALVQPGPLIGVALEFLGRNPQDVRALGPVSAGGNLSERDRLRLQRFLGTCRYVFHVFTKTLSDPFCQCSNPWGGWQAHGHTSYHQQGVNPGRFGAALPAARHVGRD